MHRANIELARPANIMLAKRASSSSQFRRVNGVSLLKCASQLEIAKKITKAAYFGGSRSFKVIDVDIFLKLVTSERKGKKKRGKSKPPEQKF